MCVTTGALILSGIGAAIQVAGTIAGGNAAKQAGDYKAAQEQQAAGQARATSQRAAINQQRSAAFAQSKLQANAAASGGTVTGASTVNASENIAGIGKYNEMSEIFTGEEKARGLESGAEIDRFQGRAAQSASRTKAFGTIASTAGTMYSQYGFGQPGVDTSGLAQPGDVLTGPSGAGMNVEGLPWTYS